MSEERGKPAAKRIRRAAAEEKRLLAKEANSEKLLMKARSRLARAEDKLADARARFERRERDVRDAEAELRSRQTERAAGPGLEQEHAEDEEADQIAAPADKPVTAPSSG